MRVKVRFNSEGTQPPITVDLRFLPRIGERIELGFRKVIEVLEVRRVDNDNRYGGIVRAKYVEVERRPTPVPPRPLAMPMPIPSLAVEPMPAAARVTTGTGAVYANVAFNELAAAVQGQTSAPDLSSI